LTEILKQKQYEPVPVGEQVAVIYAGTNGHLDSIPVDQVKKFQSEFLAFLASKHANVLEQLGKEITPDTEETLKRLIGSFKSEKGYVSKS
ncbi:MAG: F0F1 ATP synthase subunit alpha, partial [Patescibacteria group bacterium]